MSFDAEKEITRLWRSLHGAQAEIGRAHYRWRKAALELAGPDADPIEVGLRAAEITGGEMVVAERAAALVAAVAGVALLAEVTPEATVAGVGFALGAAAAIQIGTNLHNDAKDYERGTDTEERLGPARATAQGWFTAAQVKRAAHLAFGGAFLLGLYLIWHGGWPILAVGLLSLLAGYAYTGGPKPIAYSASGELFVLLFFGLVAVLGSYYLQTLCLSLPALAGASAIGLLAAAVLLVLGELWANREAGAAPLGSPGGAPGVCGRAPSSPGPRDDRSRVRHGRIDAHRHRQRSRGPAACPAAT